MAVIQRRETAAGDVRWTMRVFIGRDEHGKRKFVVKTFDGKKAAEAEGRRLERMKDQGGALVVTSKEPFVTYLTRWLDVKAGQIRARTAHDYRGIVKRWITAPPEGAPPLGPIAMNRLGREAFEQLYIWMREHGRGPRTIQYVHVVLRMALKDAVRKKLLASNPTDDADVPTRALDDSEPEDKVVRTLDQAQAGRLLEAARSDRYSALWHLLLTGGLRPSEALGLAWGHVDLEAGRVSVQRTLTRTGVKGWRLVPTKTKGSRRTVPLPPVTVRALRQWRAVQAKERLQLGAEYQDSGEDGGFVFATPFGAPLDGGNLAARNFRRIMAAAELGTWEGEGKRRRFRPGYRVYDLRHTCATLLLQAGVPLKVVSERLGHASIVLTADTYSHVLPTMQEAAADKLEAMFGG